MLPGKERLLKEEMNGQLGRRFYFNSENKSGADGGGWGLGLSGSPGIKMVSVLPLALTHCLGKANLHSVQVTFKESGRGGESLTQPVIPEVEFSDRLFGSKPGLAERG